MSRDYGLEAQKAAEVHLELCHAAADGDIPLEESPASAPFCGCQTCEIREILTAAWPFLVEAVKAGAT